MALTLDPAADRSQTLADAVAGAVREAIATGELRPDETYSVYRLADELGVSRSPVREALLRLAEAGLVCIERNRGFRVVLPTAHDVAEIVEIRLALEPAAAGRAARAADVGVVLEAFETMARAVASDDEPTFWAADRALHRAVLTLAGNARAAAIVEQLRAVTALLGPPTTATGRTLAEIHAEHAPIVAAIRDGDPPTAEAAMRAHLERTGGLLALVVGPAPEPAAGVTQADVGWS